MFFHKSAVRRLNQIDLEERSAVQNLERAHSAMEYQLQIEFLEARDVWVDDTRKSATMTLAESTFGARPSMHHNPQEFWKKRL